MYRSRVSSFNHAQLLTHGNPIGLSALATRLNDSSAGSVEAICTTDDDPLIAQAHHVLGERSAHLIFITPEPDPDSPCLPALLDFLSIRAGEMGAANLLAEVRESSQLFESFRHCGFTIYGWETVWRLPMSSPQPDGVNTASWKPFSAKDESAIRALYHALVPPLVQTSEPYCSSDTNRLVYRKNGEIVAFVESQAGSKGIYLMPIIHPSLEDPLQMLAELRHLFRASGKPVYLQMRSYQAWLTAPLEAMAAETSVHFALMARRLAVPVYAAVEQRRPALENRRPETTLPIINKISPRGQ
jgi:hypothetical protein